MNRKPMACVSASPRFPSGRPSRMGYPRLLLVGVFAAAALGNRLEARGHETRVVKQDIAVPAGGTVFLENLAGRVTVSSRTGGAVGLEATVHAESAALAESLRFTPRTEGNRVLIEAGYPVAEHDTFAYPGEHEGLSWFNTSRSTMRYQGKRVTVVSGSRRGVLLYADIRLTVPSGVSVSIHNLVGRVESTGLSSPLEIETAAADVDLRDCGDKTSVSTGSGDIEIRRAKAVTVRTGSGDVKATRVLGDATIHTGSGDVELRDVEGQRVALETGSGTLRMTDVKGELEAQTGSGDIEGSGLKLSGRLTAETGSGSVSLSGDFANVVDLEVSTSSGDVDLRVDKAPSMSLSVSTSSGDISVNVPNLAIKRRKENRLEGETPGAKNPFRIRTSSGSVTLEAS